MNPSAELILASASNRRHELMSLLGIIYTSYKPDIDEKPFGQEHSYEYVRRVARTKAETAKQMSLIQVPVLAADTIVTIDDIIIGKPEDSEDVKRNIQLLSGKEHKVLTSLCLATTAEMYESITETIVKFREISTREIEDYSLIKEPYGKAGSYAIQGVAASFVEYFIGSYTNVIGLPLLDLQKLLKKANLVS